MNAVDVFLDAGSAAAQRLARGRAGRAWIQAKLDYVLARRMLLFAAILLLLATFAAAMAPRRPLPPPPPSSLPDRAADGDAGTVERRISVDGGASTAVRVARGDILRLQVDGDVLDSVLLDGLDRIEAIEPVTPAIFEVLAERPGSYPIRLVAADRRIGRLVITP